MQRRRSRGGRLTLEHFEIPLKCGQRFGWRGGWLPGLRRRLAVGLRRRGALGRRLRLGCSLVGGGLGRPPGRGVPHRGARRLGLPGRRVGRGRNLLPQLRRRLILLPDSHPGYPIAELAGGTSEDRLPFVIRQIADIPAMHARVMNHVDSHLLNSFSHVELQIANCILHIEQRRNMSGPLRRSTGNMQFAIYNFPCIRRRR